MTRAKAFKFTSNWFPKELQEHWRFYLKDLIGKPNCRYLELGVYEGRSLFWALENIFTHSTSKAVVVDIFNGPFFDLYQQNLLASGRKKDVKTLTARTSDVLFKLKKESFDVVFIDTGHNMKSVIEDFVWSWRLLKNEGYLIFDDYQWRTENRPIPLRPEYAIDSLLMAFQGELEILHKDYQVIIRKRKGRLATCGCCSFGRNFGYDWNLKKFVREELNGAEIYLSESEAPVIEKMFMKIQWPNSELRIHDPAFSTQNARRLMTKLNITSDDFLRNPHLKKSDTGK